MRVRSLAVAFAAFFCACGPAKPATNTTTAPKPSATTASTATAPMTLDPKLGPLPPMAVVPPPGVRGSKVAERKIIVALATCSAPGPRKDPNAGLNERAKQCGTAAKLSAKSTVFTGDIVDVDLARTHTFRVEGGHCYRVYYATDAIDAVVGLRDENGDDAGESPTGAVPSDGLLCWKNAGNITLYVASGTGKGRYAAQIWGD